jgi:hypothetical protein
MVKIIQNTVFRILQLYFFVDVTIDDTSFLCSLHKDNDTPFAQNEYLD